MKDKNLIIVEGKSDTAKLKTYFDVETIETNGSAVDKDVLTLIKQASLTHNIIIFTDPDGPGEKIRKIVSAALNNDCYHAFVPKAKAISKNKVGIAETNRDDLADALLKVMKFSTNLESISFSEFKLSQSAINRKLRNWICQSYHWEPINNKSFFKRLNYLGINAQQLHELEERGLSDNYETKR